MTDKGTESFKLTQDDVQYGIIQLLQKPTPKRKAVQTLIPEDLLVKYLLNGTELLRTGPTLEEFHFKNECVVVGDLHGCFDNLLDILYNSDLPPEAEYVFLGDYVGRGDHQIEVFLLILLLKLRWPDNVHMLRGNHECVDQSQADQFYQACLDAYNSKKIFYLFHQLFDYLPIAAIVNDSILCCHGGVSQWMTSRDAIRNIARPTHSSTMNVLENCLFTDILWADPKRHQPEPFEPSNRGASYCFSEEGLRAVLRSVECDALIRGHSDIEEGIREDMKNKCYTVHSHPKSYAKPQAVFITLRKEGNRNIEIDVTRNAMDSFPAACGPPDWCEYLGPFMSQKFLATAPSNHLETFTQASLRDYWKVEETLTAQILTHTQLTHWALLYGVKVMTEIAAVLMDKMDPINARYFPKYFPLVYDMLAGGGRTFRVKLNNLEDQFITKPSPPISSMEWPIESFSVGTEDDESSKEKKERIQRVLATLETPTKQKARLAATEAAYMKTVNRSFVLPQQTNFSFPNQTALEVSMAMTPSKGTRGRRKR